MTPPRPTAPTAAELLCEFQDRYHSTGYVREPLLALDRLVAAARAEAVAPVLAVLRQLVDAMHTCDGADGQGGCSRVATRGLFGDSFRLACDEHGDDMGPITYEPQLRAALALLAADQAGEKAGKP